MNDFFQELQIEERNNVPIVKKRIGFVDSYNFFRFTLINCGMR